MFVSLGKVTTDMSICPNCQQERTPETLFTIAGNEDFMDKTFEQIGVPKFDIIWARGPERFVGFELSGDKEDFFT